MRKPHAGSPFGITALNHGVRVRTCAAAFSIPRFLVWLCFLFLSLSQRQRLAYQRVLFSNASSYVSLTFPHTSATCENTSRSRSLPRRTRHLKSYPVGGEEIAMQKQARLFGKPVTLPRDGRALPISTPAVPLSPSVLVSLSPRREFITANPIFAAALRT